jgi:hypothetical protein
MSGVLKTALAFGARGIRVFPLHGIKDGFCTCGNRAESHRKTAGKHP